MDNDPADRVLAFSDRLRKLLYWVPPVIVLGVLTLDLVQPVSRIASFGAAFLAWVMAVLIILYRSALCIRRIYDPRKRDDALMQHLELLHPGAWVLILAIHVVIIAAGVLAFGLVTKFGKSFILKLIS